LLHSLDLLGARRIVFWSGTRADAIYDDHPDNAGEEALADLREFLRELVRGTRCRHYFLVIEPWHSHVLNSESRILAFHDSLEPAIAEHVRYVMDAPNLLTAERYPDRDAQARTICRAIGDLAGVVHLKDCLLSPEGDIGLAGPGQGTLDYSAYLESIF